MDDLPREKLYLIFARMGDNAGSLKYGEWKVGIVVGFNEENFAKKWAENFEKVYGKKPSIRKYSYPSYSIIQVITRSREAWLDMNKYAQYGKYDWRIKNDVMAQLLVMEPSKVGYGLSGFFDAEGCVVSKKNSSFRISLASVNKLGLTQIQKILKICLDVSSAIRFNPFSRCYYLNISRSLNLQKLHQFVSFAELHKQKPFDEYVRTVGNGWWRAWSSNEISFLKKAFNRGLSDNAIAKALNRSTDSVAQMRLTLRLYRRKSRTPSKVDEKTIEKIWSMTRSIRKTAKILGVSYRTVQRHVYSR